jgi:hypothetical protein
MMLEYDQRARHTKSEAVMADKSLERAMDIEAAE